jgi:hypothetical protein
VEKSRGQTPAELLNAPSLKPEHAQAWEAYTSLTVYNWAELQSYLNLTGHLLEKWEIRAVMELARYREATPKWPLK